MVLIDTSVWVDLFRNAPTAEARTLNRLIEAEADIAICGMIRQETLQGIRDDLTMRRIRTDLEQTFYLPLEEPGDFDSAATIYRTLRHRGVTIRAAADCLIAAIAIRTRTPLLQRDADFSKIARVADLELYKPIP